MRNTRYAKGFTLVELLVALVVTSLILTTVATLAYALGTRNESSDDMSQKQAQVRYATLRISELIRHCKLICDTAGNDIEIWRADDDGDNRIDADELVYIEAGDNWDYIQLREPNNNPVVLIPQCSNVQFHFDVSPLQSKLVGVSFDLVENGVVRQYQINAALRGWARNLFDSSGNIVSSDDD